MTEDFEVERALDVEVGEHGSELSHLSYFPEPEFIHLQNENNNLKMHSHPLSTLNPICPFFFLGIL